MRLRPAVKRTSTAAGSAEPRRARPSILASQRTGRLQGLTLQLHQCNKLPSEILEERAPSAQRHDALRTHVEASSPLFRRPPLRETSRSACSTFAVRASCDSGNHGEYPRDTGRWPSLCRTIPVEQTMARHYMSKWKVGRRRATLGKISQKVVLRRRQIALHRRPGNILPMLEWFRLRKKTQISGPGSCRLTRCSRLKNICWNLSRSSTI